MRDSSSLSHFGVICTHANLDLHPDFATNVVRGAVIYDLRVREARDTLVLDTRGLNISKTFVRQDADAEWTSTEFALSEEHGQDLGRALTIQLQKTYGPGVGPQVKIEYSTSPTASALQWLTPEQTAGKKHPFLFTQCQAVHARSLMPCQDSPAVKFTYKASIHAPATLKVVMSALSRGSDDSASPNTRVFHFEQPRAIPAYLMALAVGDIHSKEVGPRTSIHAEGPVIEAAAWELAETEDMLKTAEDLCGPYLWGRYDVLIMPPSFPFGGMENPTVTFATPSIIAKDRSLVSLVAHEIAHSWTGNLVTNCNWEHFWLNEGWTVFVERKIVERLMGANEAELAMTNGFSDLLEELDHLGADNNLTCLVPSLDGVNPDDAFSTVPYEKGFSFLYYLQSITGVEAWEAFMKAYLSRFAEKTLSTDDFKAFLLNYFSSEGRSVDFSSVDWNAWLYTPGMPPVKPSFDSSLQKEAVQACEATIALDKKEGSASALPTSQAWKAWSTSQRVAFLDELLLRCKATPLSHTTLQHLDQQFGLGNSQNSELKFRWQRLNLSSGIEAVLPNVKEFLGSVGRMKFVRPLFRDLNRSFRPFALELFEKLRGTYHPICAKMVCADLGLRA